MPDWASSKTTWLTRRLPCSKDVWAGSYLDHPFTSEVCELRMQISSGFVGKVLNRRLNVLLKDNWHSRYACKTVLYTLKNFMECEHGPSCRILDDSKLEHRSFWFHLKLRWCYGACVNYLSLWCLICSKGAKHSSPRLQFRLGSSRRKGGIFHSLANYNYGTKILGLVGESSHTFEFVCSLL